MLAISKHFAKRQQASIPKWEALRVSLGAAWMGDMATGTGCSLPSSSSRQGGSPSWSQLNTPGSVQHRLQACRLHRLGNCSVLQCQVTARSNEGQRISSACHALNTQMPTTQEHFGAVFFPTVPTDLADWPCCLTGVSSVNHNTEPV